MLKNLFTQKGINLYGKALLVRPQCYIYEDLFGLRLMSSFKNKFYWKPKRDKANPRPKFSVILLEDDENLGRKYEVVKVERGYARHVLIPEGKADYAIKENLEKYNCTESAAKPRASLKFLNKLKNMNLILQRPKHESWEISKHHIALAFKNSFKLHVPVHCIRTDFESISSYGDYEVNVTVNRESTVPVKISVQEWEPVYKKGWKELLLGGTKEEEEDVEAHD
eukprot:gene6836-12431_t